MSGSCAIGMSGMSGSVAAVLPGLGADTTGGVVCGVVSEGVLDKGVSGQPDYILWPD